MSDASPRLCVIDSSVAVKWFLPEGEPNGERAWALLESHLAQHVALAAPDHLRLEVLNALRHKGLNAEQIRRAAAALDGFRLAWHPLDASLALAACDISARHGVTLYDAAYAALAVRLDAELITADRRLARSGAGRARMLDE
jgi:predicted nucleic acid-binding protein